MVEMNLATQRESYVVQVRRDDSGWWVISAPEVRGVHSQARRLDRVEDIARDAIALMLEVPKDSFDVALKVMPLPEILPLLNDLALARHVEQEARERLAEVTAEAARILVDKVGLTLRDTAWFLGMSYQRVGQLLDRRGGR
jgi:predicted RNase H-like HicB family nuclease